MKKVLVFALSVMVICAVAARIYYVNAHAVEIQIERYSMGEWVELEGAFLEGDYEDTDGYSIKINAAKTMSYNEYLEHYGSKSSPKTYVSDKKSVIVLEAEARNVDNIEGSLYMFQWKLVPERGNEYLLYDTYLWGMGEANVDDSAGASHFIMLAPNTEYTMHIPFAVNDNPEDGARYQYDLSDDTSLDLTIANAPMKKVIEIKTS